MEMIKEGTQIARQEADEYQRDIGGEIGADEGHGAPLARFSRASP